jgi:hypothetical protein
MLAKASKSTVCKLEVLVEVIVREIQRLDFGALARGENLYTAQCNRRIGQECRRLGRRQRSLRCDVGNMEHDPTPTIRRIETPRLFVVVIEEQQRTGLR